jgi:DNA-binding transcriptional ArsR family regulator
LASARRVRSVGKRARNRPLFRLDFSTVDLVSIEAISTKAKPCRQDPRNRLCREEEHGMPRSKRKTRAATQDLDYVVDLFKALADPVRLRIMGLLVEEERCGQELAEMLKLAPGTVTHHLQVLRTLGLVAEERRPPYTYVKLDYSKLRQAILPFLKKERVQQFAAGPDVGLEKRRVLNAFFDGPVLKSIPAQRRKKEIILEEILRRLPARNSFKEATLSQLIKKIHPDFCTIRREFIMGRYMERRDGVYRWTERGRAVRRGARRR